MAGILTTRIKGRGRRWDPTHIDAVMALAALDVGDESQAYWQAQTPPQKPPHENSARENCHTVCKEKLCMR